MSPISSRNNVPPSACSKRPIRRASAPVNAPFSCPNSSDSSSSAAMADVFSATNGWCARGLWSCSARATSSLPVPDSPVISTVMLEPASRPIERNTSCIAGAWPIIDGIAAVLPAASAPAPPFSRAALRTSSTASSMSNGFGRYSNAPPLYAATAFSRSECAVMTMIGRSGCELRRRSSSAMPLIPGMRTSVISTSGALWSSASRTCSARSKVCVSISACRSALSSTQRTDWSSSTTQTLSECSVIHTRLALLERYAQVEDGAAGPALEFDQAAVAADEFLRRGKSEPGAFRAAGDQRIEHGVL